MMENLLRVPPKSTKQDLFAEEYLVDLNATQAALRAGYSETTAKANCARLLTQPRVRTRIDILIEERAERTKLDADDVLRNLERIATEAEKTKRWNAALRALELIGRHLGMWKDRKVIEYSASINPFATGDSDEDIQRDVQRLLRVAAPKLELSN
jgi:phage terminase small subunit